MLSKVDLAHLPAGVNVYVALYTEVKNAAFLREQLIHGNQEFEYAFVDAKSVFSRTHLLAAVFRAVNDMDLQRMKSRNVHSEIVFSLSPNNNIAESFRKFGVSDQTKDLLVVKVSQAEPEAFSTHLQRNIQGKAVEFNDANITSVSDEKFIRKTYKLPSVNVAQSGSPGERTELELSILGVMALRGAT